MRDPAGGDFHADLAPGYGSRIVPDAPVLPQEPGPVATPPAIMARTGRLEVSGEIDVDTVWDVTDVSVVGDIFLTKGARLTVAAGCRVEFTGYHGLLISNGRLEAVGTAAAPIVWTTDSPGDFTFDLQDRGCWNGITFLNVPAANPASQLRWCVLEYSKALPSRGLDPRTPRVGGAALDGAGGALRIVGRSPVTISHCVLRHNVAVRGGALAAHYGAAPVISNSLLHDNRGLERSSVALLSYSTPRLVHNTVTDNLASNESSFFPTGAVDNFHSRTRFVGNIIYNNTTTHYDDYQVFESSAYFCRWNNIGNFGEGEGGLDADPGFVLTGSRPYALGSGSVCVDAGNADAGVLWLKPMDLAGHVRLQGAEIDMGAYEGVFTTGLEDLPTAVAALRAAPNPFNPLTTLHFELTEPMPVDLMIHDGRGRRVRHLVHETMPAGPRAVTWNGRDDNGLPAAAGVYTCRLQTGARSAIVKITLIK